MVLVPMARMAGSVSVQKLDEVGIKNPREFAYHNSDSATTTPIPEKSTHMGSLISQPSLAALLSARILTAISTMKDMVPYVHLIPDNNLSLSLCESYNV